jgi:hypothetical protein
MSRKAKAARLAARRDPKSITGSKKPPLHLVPGVAIALESIALRSGGEKHGPWNWREHPIEAMEHIGAVQRHIQRWIDGEDTDPGTGVSPLANARATLAILLDANACGLLIDNRPPAGQAAAVMERITRR